jgi:DNA invertase Pin-like site-specific DNA recombinase
VTKITDIGRRPRAYILVNDRRRCHCTLSAVRLLGYTTRIIGLKVEAEQIAMLERACRAVDAELVETIHEPVASAVPAPLSRRPVLRSALDRLASQEFDGIAVPAIGALGSDARDLALIYRTLAATGRCLLVAEFVLAKDELQEEGPETAGIGVIDPRSAEGLLLGRLLASLAELERAKRQLLAAKKREAVSPRRRPPHEERERSALRTLVRQLKDDEGRSFRQISTELTARGLRTPSGETTWSVSSVQAAYGYVPPSPAGAERFRDMTAEMVHC